MAIKKYKNYGKVKTAHLKSYGDVLDPKTKALIDVGVEFPYANFGTNPDDKVEFHAYSTAGDLLGSRYKSKWEVVQEDGGIVLNLKPADELKALDLTIGKFRYVYNIYKTLVSKNVYIQEISPSRTEVVLRPVKSRDPIVDFKTNIEFLHFANKVKIGAQVGYQMFDVNQDGNVNILDIISGMGDTIVPSLTYAEIQIILQYILGNKSLFSEEGTANLSSEELEKMGLDITPQGDVVFDNGSTPRDVWEKLAKRLLANYDDFENLAPEDLNTYLSFGKNNYSLVTNWMVDDINYPDSPHAIVVKLYEPLPSTIQEHRQLSICNFYSAPLVDKISLVGSPLETHAVRQLAPHNKNIDVKFDKKQSTDYETWEQVLGYKPATAQSLIDFYLSGSHIQQAVNIDFTNYSNFIKFGSAAERLENFKYKLQKIETYDSQSDAYSLVSGSYTTQRYYKELRNELIRGFDAYEKFMYYESGSFISQSGAGAVTTVDYQDATLPKTNSTKPYTLYHTTSSEFTTWYDNQLSNAQNHDNSNPDSFKNNLPFHIKSDSENAEFLLFMDMVGQHFDTIWTYAKHMTNTANRAPNIDSQYNYDPNAFGSDNLESLHKDLTYFVAGAQGLNLKNGQDLVKLWKYALGENQYREGKIKVDGSKAYIYGGAFANELENGTLFVPGYANGTNQDYETTVTDVYHNSMSLSTAFTGTAFTTGDYSISYNIDNSEDTSLSSNDYTKEIWRRLLNNLPYMLKTKGTARSVKALISCYGIPATILQILEYGGPQPTGKSYYINERFVYALHYTGSNQYFPVEWKNTTAGRRPDTIQFRFASDLDYNTGASITNRNDVRLMTLGGGDTGSALWDIRAVPLSGSTFHDVSASDYGHTSNGTFNSLSASIEEWGFLQFNLSGSDGYKSITSSVYPIFDGEFWSVALQRTSASDATDIDQTYKLMLKKSIGDEVAYNSVSDMSFTAATSASYKSSFTSSDWLYVTDSGSNVDGGWFSGSIQEFRLWNIILSESMIDIHAKAPLAYAGGTTSSFYDNLEMRLPFTEIYEHEVPGVANNTAYSSSTVSYLKTYQPTASLVNFGTTNNSYKTFEIENNFELPNIGAARRTSNKIRVEDAELLGNLNLKIRSEKRANDWAPIDSPKLDVFFNPQQPVNEDIISDFSGLEFDEFIGDPEDQYRPRYEELKKVRDQYFNRFDTVNNFFDYIRLIQYYDSTLFDHIKSLLPYRAHENVGLVIEPHILERSKYERWKRPEKLETHFRNTKAPEDKLMDYYDKGIICTHSLAGEFRYNSGSVETGTDDIAGFGLWEGYQDGKTIPKIQEWLGNTVPITLSTTRSLSQEEVLDMTSSFTTEFPITASQFVIPIGTILATASYQLTGESVDGIQTGLVTTYLADIQKFTNSHESSSYIVGYGGAGYVSNPEEWHGNPEKEGYHPFIHKQVLNYKYLIHSGSQYEMMMTDGEIKACDMVNYGYWDNDRSITGSEEMNSTMASKGYLPTEVNPLHTYSTAVRNQRYGGTRITKMTTYDLKDPIEAHETSPNQLVVSDVSSNTLQVE